MARTDLSIDPVIHEASRLLLVSVLHECGGADFNFLLATTRLTRGNFSTHMGRLLKAGYVEEKKEFVGRKPHTEYRLTKAGRSAFKKYQKVWQQVTNGGLVANAAMPRKT